MSNEVVNGGYANKSNFLWHTSCWNYSKSVHYKKWSTTHELHDFVIGQKISSTLYNVNLGTVCVDVAWIQAFFYFSCVQDCFGSILVQKFKRWCTFGQMTSSEQRLFKTALCLIKTLGLHFDLWYHKRLHASLQRWFTSGSLQNFVQLLGHQYFLFYLMLTWVGQTVYS